MAGTSQHRRFGWIRKLPSRRYQASYVGPDTARHRAPGTFAAKIDAEGWLASESRLIDSGAWSPPGERTGPASRPT
ncbi:MAG: site-specific integrase, partial [Geodermatophilaceae bacterium]|nr:site-specific integrase [Geodermatophilaceae bacterium]